LAKLYGLRRRAGERLASRERIVYSSDLDAARTNL
jgi:hypothetical protein